MNVKEIANSAAKEVSKVIVGKEKQVRLVLMSIFCGGHVLLDDLPGVGKTTLVKAISKVLGCSFSRVQFTPDLLPSDILGMNVFNQKTGDFSIMHGPVMTNIFLADEINRAIPRTQSALLEAMEELQVTIDGKTYPLPEPFLVLATQNPVEMESTFHLPIAQMDRFLIKLSLGYLSADEEKEMLRTVGDGIPFESLEAILNEEKIVMIQNALQEVQIQENVLEYIVKIVEATRNHHYLTLPVGPRGSRSLYRAGKVWAAMEGRDFVTPDDIKVLAPYILPHRIMLNNEARLNGLSAEDVIANILSETEAPESKENMINAKDGKGEPS